MIYLDNAATTRVTETVFDKMKPFFCEQYGNPSAVYGFASKTMRAIDTARENIARVIGATSREIYFTAGGTESDNWALKMALEISAKGEGHIITTKIEHPAILNTCKYLEKHGFEITYLEVNDKGVINIEALKQAIRQDTVLVSVMAANNEIGTIEPLMEIGSICHERGVLFHTDAVQAFGHIPLNVNEMHIDLLSASGHKFHGPKGVGFLYIRNGINLPALIHGGEQEKRKRAGTLNTAGIVGMGEAAIEAFNELEENISKEKSLRDYLISRILKEIPDSKLNGDAVNRLPGNAHFSFPGVEGESLLIQLDMKGICASSGSACTAGSTEPSHVLMAIGLDAEEARGSLRLSLSKENTKEEIDKTVEELKLIVDKLRRLSPQYELYLKNKGRL